MAPPTPPIQPTTASLANAVLTNPVTQKKRRDLPHASDFDLKRDCKLQSLMQYECDAEEMSEEERRRTGRKGTGTVVRCKEVERLFRRCANGMVVETTSWEEDRLKGRDPQHETTRS